MVRFPSGEIEGSWLRDVAGSIVSGWGAGRQWAARDASQVGTASGASFFFILNFSSWL